MVVLIIKHQNITINVPQSIFLTISSFLQTDDNTTKAIKYNKYLI